MLGITNTLGSTTYNKTYLELRVSFIPGVSRISTTWTTPHNDWKFNILMLRHWHGHAKCLAIVGVEPTTFALLARRSNRLSYTAYTHRKSCCEYFTWRSLTAIEENWKALTTQLAMLVSLESDTLFWILTTKRLAERGFDPRTSGLWAQHASTAPLCSTNDELRERYNARKVRLMQSLTGWPNKEMRARNKTGHRRTWNFPSMTKTFKKEKKKKK